jgi:putative transposase
MATSRRHDTRTVDALSVELATLAWVAWFNHHRLLEPIGYIPPAEAEEDYWRQLQQPGGPPAAPAGSVKKGESNSRGQQTVTV